MSTDSKYDIDYTDIIKQINSIKVELAELKLLQNKHFDYIISFDYHKYKEKKLDINALLIEAILLRNINAVIKKPVESTIIFTGPYENLFWFERFKELDSNLDFVVYRIENAMCLDPMLKADRILNSRFQGKVKDIREKIITQRLKK